MSRARPGALTRLVHQGKVTAELTSEDASHLPGEGPRYGGNGQDLIQ